ncbi:hypothetical protein EAE91_06790 [Photorhabdus noenieputensis]|uniref:ATP-grasp fold amidoligase family protein n=1 Tax=Photorhabdus noenieputensis TaxID=1208607 RepID=UPI001BD3A4EB|nr:ATP-grasp fold amidoligase family protein [Photorhabdus noenieputensis]MBS9436891.1 hypothetical protein [Photorhabdus noenieputensis]
MNKYLKILRKKLIYHGCGVFPEYVTKSIYKNRSENKLDLKKSTTFNDKLQWLKLNKYKDSKFVTIFADKFTVRNYIEERNCQEILTPIYGIWDNSSEINWSKLPKEFIMKCNHGAGYNIICKNKDQLNINDAINKLNLWMKNLIMKSVIT